VDCLSIISITFAKLALSKSPARSSVPSFLGSFQRGETLILLLSDAGVVLESFDQLLASLTRSQS
jgi:hypothetical protein